MVLDILRSTNKSPNFCWQIITLPPITGSGKDISTNWFQTSVVEVSPLTLEPTNFSSIFTIYKFQQNFC